MRATARVARETAGCAGGCNERGYQQELSYQAVGGASYGIHTTAREQGATLRTGEGRPPTHAYGHRGAHEKNKWDLAENCWETQPPPGTHQTV